MDPGIISFPLMKILRLPVEDGYRVALMMNGQRVHHLNRKVQQLRGNKMRDHWWKSSVLFSFLRVMLGNSKAGHYQFYIAIADPVSQSLLDRNNGSAVKILQR
jgi:hypothetical protein